MKKICPCCNKEFTPPTQSVGTGEDIGSLFSCDHCQSVLKWEGDSFKIIHESKWEPIEINGAAEMQEKIQEDIQHGQEGLEADFAIKEDMGKEVTEDFAGENKSEEPFIEDQELQKIEEIPSKNSEENFENVTENHEVFSEQSEQEYNVENDKKEQKKGSEMMNKKSGEQENQEEDWKMMDEEDGEQETNQDFSDVEEYGNAQATSEKGFLRYDIYISGLDSVEIEEQVREVLEDPRFKWDVSEILESQDKGHLVIKNLNPIKAVCLVSDLSFLSVKVSWKQYMALNIKPTQPEE